MIDDKVIEAALDEWFGNPDWRDPSTFDWDHDPRKDMRAALAAADKVRAEGFDFNHEVDVIAEAVNNQESYKLSESGLRRAFAAGLAKGEADRAALVEALKPFAWFASLLPKSVPDYMPLKADLSGSGDLTVAHLRAAALALIRKGV